MTLLWWGISSASIYAPARLFHPVEPCPPGQGFFLRSIHYTAAAHGVPIRDFKRVLIVARHDARRTSRNTTSITPPHVRHRRSFRVDQAL
jgi:hypothetical protein